MNFANNVIIRDASGIFRSKREVIDSKAATLIIIEDETENELSAYDIWHAQFCEEWRLLHEFSVSSSIMSRVAALLSITSLLLMKIPDASRIMTLFAKFIDCLLTLLDELFRQL